VVGWQENAAAAIANIAAQEGHVHGAIDSILASGAPPLLVSLLEEGTAPAKHAAVAALQSLQLGGVPSEAEVTSALGNVERILVDGRLVQAGVLQAGSHYGGRGRGSDRGLVGRLPPGSMASMPQPPYLTAGQSQHGAGDHIGPWVHGLPPGQPLPHAAGASSGVGGGQPAQVPDWRQFLQQN